MISFFSKQITNETQSSEQKKENWYDNKDEVNVKVITSCLKTKPKNPPISAPICQFDLIHVN